jgi:hypothetical protein
MWPTRRLGRAASCRLMLNVQMDILFGVVRVSQMSERLNR